MTDEQYGEELARRFAAWASDQGLLEKSAAWASDQGLLEKSTEEQVALLARAYISGALAERAVHRWTHERQES